jgi:hypothetical protein
MVSVFRTLRRLLRHTWLDHTDAARAVPPALAERLRRDVAASEQRHTGEVRICVEGSLPVSYLWRHLRQRVPLPELVRQRALMMFAKLRVWDTEHNNGVLIYLLLAEHAIEIVADRGVARHVPPQHWQALARDMASAFKAGRFEQGLTAAVDAVDQLLRQHFALAAGAANPNELPDAPLVR